MNLRLRIRYALSRGPKLIWEIPSELAALALARRRRIQGIDVSVFDGGRDTSAIFTKISEALEILRDVDARRFSRIKRDLSRVFVTDAQGAPYLPLSNSCWLSRKRVVRNEPTMTALSIVHEATHARLFRAGVDDGHSRRERIERRCVAEQISFLEKLKAADYQGTDEWAAFFDRSLENPWWTPEAIFRQKQEMLREQSAPMWLRRLHALVFRPRKNPRDESC